MPKDRSSDYEVGYGKPPVEGRFRKGHSGNPKGRPKKARLIRDPVVDNYIGDAILAEAARPVTVTENGAIATIPMAQALVRSLHVAGLKGDRHAAAQSIKMIKQAQDRTLEGRQIFYEATVKYLRESRTAIDRAAAAGQSAPDLPVHPDDVRLDHDALQVRMNGPVSLGEQRQWEEMRARAASLEPVRDKLLATRATRPEQAAEIDRELDVIETILRQTDSLFPSEETRRRPGFDLEAHRRATAGAFSRRRRSPPKRPS